MDQQKTNGKMTFKKAVKLSVESYNIGDRFFGYDLKEKVMTLYPKCANSYVETILREARDVARDMYKCVDTRKGLYERI